MTIAAEIMAAAREKGFFGKRTDVFVIDLDSTQTN
jgi:hypothetical protein